jgi:Ca2+-binding EF-hand superfamily protein
MVSSIQSGSLALMQRQFDPTKMAQHREQMFTEADTSGDGALDIAEFTAMQENRPAPPNAPAGGPTAEEMFAEIDTDGDGSITKAEMTAQEEKMQARMEEMRGQQTESSSQLSLVDYLNNQDEEEETTANLWYDQSSAQLNKQFLDLLG